MTTSETSTIAAADPVAEAVAAAPAPLLGNPGVLGLPTAIAGALGLGLANAGWFPGGASTATLAILLSCTSIGLLIATVWAAALGQNAAASLFGVFFGFYASYCALSVSLAHNWFGPTTDGGTSTVAAWLLCWLVAFVVLTAVTLRLPSSFTLLLIAVDVALVLLLVSTTTGSTGLARIAAVAIFVFIATAIYLYVDLMSKETGGRGLPLGRPLLSS